MGDLLTFISKRIKMVDGLSTKDLTAACQLTKSKFYRCIAEPFRFSDAQLQTIGELLKLSDGEKQILMQYKHGAKAREASQFSELLNDVILGKNPAEEDYTSRIFALYRSTLNQSEVLMRSADELAEMICGSLPDSPAGDGDELELLLFNTFTPEKAPVVRGLLTSILKRPSSKIFRHSVFHIINNNNIGLEQQVEAFSSLYSLMARDVYALRFIDMSSCILGDTDCALIRYPNQDHKQTFMLITIANPNDASVYTFEDSSLRDFLLSHFTEYGNLRKQNSVLSLDPIEMSAVLAETAQKYKQKVLISHTLSPDNLSRQLWSTDCTELLSDPVRAAKLRAYADPAGNLTGYSDSQFVQLVLGSFIQRSELSELLEVTNVIAAAGLRDFAVTGSTAELNAAGLALDKAQVIQQLQFIKARLGRQTGTGQQSFYLIDPIHRFPPRTFTAFKDYRIALSFQDSGCSDSLRILSEPVVATAFCEYVTEELLNEETRSNFGSIVMSDDRAEAFISALIDDLSKE